ncbi:MAG: TadE/TadG family type IV pilus assembly protein [Chloroflexia bacterium]
MTRIRVTKRTNRKGQAVVETAVLGLFLALLLAAAVDFGRAYFTATVVENMAGEGAAYAAKFPAKDAASPSCAGSVLPHNNIQDRARQVAIDRGMVIHRPSQADVRVEVLGYQNPTDCRLRCAGTAIKVTVTYHIDDLFLPGLVGMSSITIRKSATQMILDDGLGTDCP